MATSTNRMKRKIEQDVARDRLEESILAVEAGKLSGDEQWVKFKEMWKELSHLRQLQDPHYKMSLASNVAPKEGKKVERAVPEYDYKTALIDLVKWLKRNGAKIDGAVPVPEEARKVNSTKAVAYKPILSIAPASVVEGNGVFVTREAPVGEKLIEVPRKLFLTTETLSEHLILKYILDDPLIASIESIQLAITLVYERYKDKSFFEPYIRALPRTYSTVYYWSIEELESLRGTPVFQDAFVAIITAVRAYYEALMIIFVKDIMRKSLFTYDTFVWALSAVYSRQNTVPSISTLQSVEVQNAIKAKQAESSSTDAKNETVSPVEPINHSKPNGPVMVLALIPGYDMFNYAPGPNTSHYVVEDNGLILTSMAPLKTGEQAYMWYGARPNSDLLLHQGFVPDQNPSDYEVFNASLAPSDPLKTQKTELLEKLEFKFEKNGAATLPLFGSVLAPSALLFMRVLACNEESVLTAENLAKSLKERTPLHPATEQTALKLFRLKCTQLLNAIPDNIQQQADQLTSTVTSPELHSKLAISRYLASLQKTVKRTLELVELVASKSS